MVMAWKNQVLGAYRKIKFIGELKYDKKCERAEIYRIGRRFSKICSALLKKVNNSQKIRPSCMRITTSFSIPGSL
jgi:hypothetical protein